MDIVIPKPQSPQGFSTTWQRTKAKHVLRFFAFVHDEKPNLAVRHCLHFVDNTPKDCPGADQGCLICAEAEATKNRRLRAIERFRVAIVDMEEQDKGIQTYDMPTSAYALLIKQIEEAGSFEDIVGNEGVDFTLGYDSAAVPSKQYALTPKIKGNKVLTIGDADVLDLFTLDYLYDNTASGKPDATEAMEQSEGSVSFLNGQGKRVTGKLTGNKRKDKLEIEAEGRLWYVASDKLSGSVPMSALEKPQEKPVKQAKPTKDTKPTKTKGDAITVGDPVVFIDTDGTKVTGTVTAVSADGKTANVEDSQYRYPDVATDKLAVVPF